MIFGSFSVPVFFCLKWLIDRLSQKSIGCFYGNALLNIWGFNMGKIFDFPEFSAFSKLNVIAFFFSPIAGELPRLNPITREI
jgi:hypothetical protein